MFQNITIKFEVRNRTNMFQFRIWRPNLLPRKRQSSTCCQRTTTPCRWKRHITRLAIIPSLSVKRTITRAPITSGMTSASARIMASHWALIKFAIMAHFPLSMMRITIPMAFINTTSTGELTCGSMFCEFIFNSFIYFNLTAHRFAYTVLAILYWYYKLRNLKWFFKFLCQLVCLNQPY